MFLVVCVCLSVCLFVCEQHYSKSYERIGMNAVRGSRVVKGRSDEILVVLVGEQMSKKHHNI